jgi:hypothetical protein
MKKTILIILTVLIHTFSWGQAQINTKKVKISDFTQKVTKVVLTGNPFMDGALQDEVTARWRVSPYEFCTLEEFNSIKGNGNYYFLMCTSGQFKKESEPSLLFLTLIKGGKGADKGIAEMLEVISMPIASAKYPTGRELVFLPAFLDIIQDHVTESMEKDRNAYGGLGNYTANMNRSEGLDIIFSEDDLCEGVLEQSAEMFESGVLRVTDEDEADSYLAENADNVLVSYVAAPEDPEPGSFCYKMLIDTHTHTLYYYKKHKIGPKAGRGFTIDDIKKIYSERKR